MTIPLLDYSPSSQNQRVVGFEVPGDEQPWVYCADRASTIADIEELINAAYRQIFNEQQMIQSNRQLALESQLRSGQISVKQFIRGLVTSPVFRSRYYDTNSNYRFVQLCVQRLLGREIYSDREKLAWSIVLATKGLYGFVDQLLQTDEYQANFGDQTVPYQRRRILPQRSRGELPFARMARYDQYYRDQQPTSSYDRFTTFAWGAIDWPTVAGVLVGGGAIVTALISFSLWNIWAPLGLMQRTVS